MPGGVAFVNSNAGITELHNFVDQAVLRLGVGPGTYVVFGRVVVENNDGDSQNAMARITSKDGSNLIDKVEVRLPERGDGFNEGSSQTLSLQGTLRVAAKETDVVDIRCNTFRGSGRQSSLFAIEVSELRFKP